MDLRNLNDKFRDLVDRLPQSNADRAKIVFVAILLPVLLIWLIYFAFSNFGGGPSSRPLDTPGWRIARELDQQITAEAGFLDVGFVVAAEKPLRFSVVGAVHSQNDLDRLVLRLQELRPEGDYDMTVEVLP
ncbi:MAG: hypothetical protein KF699_15155 [Phycisphaeraceae bacterium]|nr:hypothetical protein [Phycisphaeraceae bacterium]MBX3407712.1 hypothetical protein [Phycisphaeraceae bacterium]